MKLKQNYKMEQIKTIRDEFILDDPCRNFDSTEVMVGLRILRDFHYFERDTLGSWTIQSRPHYIDQGCPKRGSWKYVDSGLFSSSSELI